MHLNYSRLHPFYTFSEQELSSPLQLLPKYHSTPTRGASAPSPIVVSESESGSRSTPAEQEYWIQELGLRNKERDILITGDWLNDLHVAAVNKLLKAQFPHQNGLQDTLALADLCRFQSSPTDFVQVVNISRSHWVCVSNVFSPPGVVEVFDSMPAYSTTSSTLKKQVASILKAPGKSFDLHHIDVQRQMGGSDCCLFAVAFAMSLCMRKDPHTERYAQPMMRDHLARCLDEKRITDFPHPEGRKRLGRHRIINRKRVDVFCICRLPWDKYDRKRGPLVQCVSCREWYHQNCMNIDKDIVDQPSAKFVCGVCLNI